MGKLAGKVALITGAAQGQGEATARLFAKEGAKVILTDVLDDKGAALAKELEDALYCHLDVSSEADWIDAAKTSNARFGGIDILINNAGIVFWGGSILDIDRSEFERFFSVNLIGAWLGIKHIAPTIIGRGGGAIVNVSSIAGLIGVNGISPYAASKWALRGINRTAALELGPKKVRVNAVFPGVINTPMGNIANEEPDQLNQRFSRLPLGRIGEPIDIAKANLYLASDESSYMTGAELVVDGGMTTGNYSNALPGGVD